MAPKIKINDQNEQRWFIFNKPASSNAEPCVGGMSSMSSGSEKAVVMPLTQVAGVPGCPTSVGMFAMA